MSMHERVTKARPFTEIMAKLEKAALNDQKLHLDVALVRAMVSSPVYAKIADMKAQEFAELWDGQNPQSSQPESNSAPTGSNQESSEPNGSLPGTMLPLVHAADERLASATTERLSRLSKHKKR